MIIIYYFTYVIVDINIVILQLISIIKDMVKIGTKLILTDKIILFFKLSIVFKKIKAIRLSVISAVPRVSGSCGRPRLSARAREPARRHQRQRRPDARRSRRGRGKGRARFE